MNGEAFGVQFSTYKNESAKGEWTCRDRLGTSQDGTFCSPRRHEELLSSEG
jgi:hypothetical protein